MRLIHFGDHKHMGRAGTMAWRVVSTSQAVYCAERQPRQVAGRAAVDPLPLFLALGIEHDQRSSCGYHS